MESVTCKNSLFAGAVGDYVSFGSNIKGHKNIFSGCIKN